MLGRRGYILLLVLLTITSVNLADDFVDDLYYQPQRELRKSIKEDMPLTPSYDKNIREIVFVDDTISSQSPDTVKAIIKYHAPYK